MPDRVFTAFGLTEQDVARLRERFAAWPRDAGAGDPEAGKDTGTGQPAPGTAGEEPAPTSGETAARQPRSHRDSQSPGCSHQLGLSDSAILTDSNASQAPQVEIKPDRHD
jgi:hypothetical protein